MSGRGRVRVFMAMSLDGFVAGEGDDLSWLDPPDPDQVEDTFTPFLADVGALLMGRRTYDVVSRMDVPWPYEDRPTLVLTTRPFVPVVPQARPMTAPIAEAVAAARAAAGARDVYVDGAAVVRQGLAAGLVDELTLTVVPQLLGAGTRLFAELERQRLDMLGARAVGGGLVEVRYAPNRRSEAHRASR